MTPATEKLVGRALTAGHAFIASTVSSYTLETLPAPVFDLLQLLNRAESSMLPASNLHDAGAFAQCEFCRRYTCNPYALNIEPGKRATCDCGRDDGWSHAFVQPNDQAVFALHLSPLDWMGAGTPAQPPTSSKLPPLSSPDVATGSPPPEEKTGAPRGYRCPDCDDPVPSPGGVCPGCAHWRGL